MKKFNPLYIFLPVLASFFSFSALSQANCTILQVNNIATISSTHNRSFWFSLMELRFLLMSLFFAFATAIALKDGKFGKGMNLLTWGFLVMAIVHLHMQIEHYYSYNPFKSLFGEPGGSVAWFIALIITWIFAGLGFYQIYKASKGH